MKWVSLLSLALSVGAVAETVRLSQLDLSPVRQSWGEPKKDQSVTGTPMSVAGRPFAHGVGTHARSLMRVELDGRATQFRAWCGVDDNARGGNASVAFRVVTDGKTAWSSGTMTNGVAARDVAVALDGVRELLLIAGDAGDGNHYDHADWAEAAIDYAGASPRIAAMPPQEAVVLTPPPAPAPRINGPLVYGCRPGHPFLYRIPCTGDRPMSIAADGLPASLKLNPDTGLITGVAPERGEYALTLRASNGRGKAERPFRIVAGDKLALTPPMGWNHWYIHFNRITAAMMRRAADVIVDSGMADAGYQYVNMDDCWMNAKSTGKYQTDTNRVGPLRDAQGRIQPNAYFPDMKGLADYIHAKGLKAGLYTSPGPSTCAGFGGAWEHEAQDARTFAEWGYDFLKYDWCSYGRIAKGKTLEDFQKPYRLMGGLLKQQDRDIVFNLCQYGMGEVWKWGAEVGGHSWRTGGDLGFELNRIFEVALKNVGLREYNRPGAWNDPDYLQIGWIGAQRNGVFELSHQCPLTPNEQYSFVALWCLMASPLFYSGDMDKLDAFTLGILCNPELIDINQDPLGQCARLLSSGAEGFVLAKDMADGSKAVGFCNSSEWPAEFSVTWKELGLRGPAKVRDCWRIRELGEVQERFAATMPPRFVGVYRVSR